MRPTFVLQVKGELQVNTKLFGRPLSTAMRDGRHIFMVVIMFMRGSSVYKYREVNKDPSLGV